jgi:hypothetical protein
MGYILDESVQQPGIIFIPQKLQQSALFGKRLEFYDDVHQPPTDILHEQDDNEYGDLEAHKPTKEFSPCALQTIIFSWRRTKYIRERHHPLFYFFNLPRITHGLLERGPSTQQLYSYWDGTHIVVLD